MRIHTAFPWALTVAMGAIWFAGLSSAPAQVQPAFGQLVRNTAFSLNRTSDGAVVGWCARSSDGTHEYWAYVDGQFVWAGSEHTAANPWTLNGVYDANLPTGGFEAFRTEVLSRAAAEDETIIFHNMTVTESITEN